jgi:hypothetical protein
MAADHIHQEADRTHGDMLQRDPNYKRLYRECRFCSSLSVLLGVVATGLWGFGTPMRVTAVFDTSYEGLNFGCSYLAIVAAALTLAAFYRACQVIKISSSPATVILAFRTGAFALTSVGVVCFILFAGHR